jgi:predicted aminopeptidase
MLRVYRALQALARFLPEFRQGARRGPWPGGAQVVILVVLTALAGCESVGYYAHMAGGQLKLLSSREPVDRALARLDEAQQDPLRERLIASQRVLAFAEDSLGLDVGGRYRSYVELERDSVVWNLFAAPVLSLEPHTWCYPIVGCAPYRGYFSKDRAQAYERKLAARGLETHLGDVAAYSTLGWFDDPLLSSFIGLPETEFVELLLHELAHSRVWIKGDAGFNESFASFVGREGLRQWLTAEGRSQDYLAHQHNRRASRAVRRYLMSIRESLADLYAGPAVDETKLARKTEILAVARRCLERLAEQTGSAGYGRIAGRLNNAYLASLATYEDLVPGFAALFEALDRDWQRFYDEVGAFEAVPADERRARLRGSGQQHIAAEGDDQRADEIQCESFPGHGLDGEPLGAVHDDVGRSGHRQHEGAGGAHGGGYHDQPWIHASAHGGGGEDGHEQGGGGRVAGGFGQEGHRQADDQHDREQGQFRQAGEQGADGFAQS